MVARSGSSPITSDSMSSVNKGRCSRRVPRRTESSEDFAQERVTPAPVRNIGQPISVRHCAASSVERASTG